MSLDDVRAENHCAAVCDEEEKAGRGSLAGRAVRAQATRTVHVLAEASAVPACGVASSGPTRPPGRRTRLIRSLCGHHPRRPRYSELFSHGIHWEAADVLESEANGQRLIVEMGAGDRESGRGDAVGTEHGPGQRSPARNEAVRGLRNAQLWISQEANKQDEPLLTSRGNEHSLSQSLYRSMEIRSGASSYF